MHTDFYNDLIIKNGYPLYAYDVNIIKDKIRNLSTSFRDFNLLYSMKCNPNKDILKIMLENGIGIDAASSNEVLAAEKVGVHKSNIFYSSPGKRDIDIINTMEHCTIIADSIHEVELINSLAYDKGMSLGIGLRINVSNDICSNDAFEVMCGGASKFGIDLDAVLAKINIFKSMSNVKINGIHIYFGSQILNIDVLLNNFKVIAKVAVLLMEHFDIKFVDFGGGFGVCFSESDIDIDLNLLYSSVYNDANVKKLLLSNVNCLIESGRYLVSQAGCYLTRIVDIKESFGKKYLIVYGGINGFFRPVFTGMFHNISILTNSSEFEKAIIAGNLCTPLDVFCDELILPKAVISDIVKIDNAGAYGYSMSLLEFISHDKPAEILFY